MQLSSVRHCQARPLLVYAQVSDAQLKKHPWSHLLHLLDGSLLGSNLCRPELRLVLLHLLGMGHLPVRLHLGLHLFHAHPCLALQLCYIVFGPLQRGTEEHCSGLHSVIRLMLFGTRYSKKWWQTACFSAVL